MRISPDKLNKLAHTVADTLAEINEVGFLDERNRTAELAVELACSAFGKKIL